MESVHPLVVHFPIGLLISGVAVDVAALALKRPGLHRVAVWNLTLGTLAAAAAVGTGLLAQRVAKHSFEIWEVMEQHERLGICTLILGIMVTTPRLLTHDQLKPWARMALLVVALVMLVTLGWGAHLGGRLVYEFGVGGSFGR